MALPRNIAGPVVRGSDFWGRNHEKEHLREMLRRGSVLLTGPRRHGKSSLMYAIRDQPGDNCEVILIDVEWIDTPEEFLATTAAELLARDAVRSAIRKAQNAPSALIQWISSAIDQVDVGVGGVGEMKIRLRKNLGDTAGWPELASQMLATLRGLPERTVLILDEFPMMVGNMLQSDEASGLRFLRWFRTFRQSPGTERLSFLLGGSTNIEPLLELLRAEALLGDLQRFRISPFSSAQSLAFVQELLASEAVNCESDVAEAIIAVTGTGVPYYLQVMIAECVREHRRLQHTLSAEGVRQIYEEYVIGPIGRHRFSHYHTRLRIHYRDLEHPARIVLAALCHGPKTFDELRQELASVGADVDVLEQLLVHLEGDYYVVVDGQVASFSDGLLRDWWKRNSVIPKGR